MSCSHEYNLKVKSIPNPGRETRRYICQHGFKADSADHAMAYANGMSDAFHKLSALSAPCRSLEEAYKEGYTAGEHLSMDFPRNFDMIVKDIDDGWQVSFIIDK